MSSDVSNQAVPAGEAPEPGRLPLGRLAFTASLALIFATALFVAREFRSNAAILPNLTCIAGLIGCFVQMAFDVHAARSKKAAERIFDIGFEEGSSPVSAMVSFYIWLAVILAVSIVFGILIAAFAFPFAYIFYHLYRGEDTAAQKMKALARSLMGALVCGGFIFIVFDQVLRIVWPLSVIQSL